LLDHPDVSIIGAEVINLSLHLPTARFSRSKETAISRPPIHQLSYGNTTRVVPSFHSTVMQNST
jgi:hypothetical protein